MKKQTVEERRLEILAVTCQVVIERGFAATRISDVAKHLNVSNSLIHYHFDSKESLLAAAFEYYARQDVLELEEDIRMAPDASSRLARLIENYVPEGSQDLEWMLWIDAWGEALRNPLMKRISQDLDEQSILIFERVLQEGIDSGEFNCPNPSASAARITGLIDGLAIQYAAHEAMMTREDLINSVTWLATAEVGASEGQICDVQSTATLVAVSANKENVISAADVAAIRVLVERYCDTLNNGQLDEWTSLWSSDAEWMLFENKTATGQPEIRALLEWSLSHVLDLVQVAPLVIVEAGSNPGLATGRVVIREDFRLPDKTLHTQTGRYEDQYVRTVQGWRFARRQLSLL
ncbi:MAG: TetR family transcriptional regulator [Ilumatobacteraceae bacterium]|nr:TetR family transcriptional regulator [Ilumatobacteraceae bacterium]